METIGKRSLHEDLSDRLASKPLTSEEAFLLCSLLLLRASTFWG